ncbi:MAG: ABC transporter permease [Flavobacteriaceae bacterium]|nr:ABC transporter permease [Flavobacteriaceae bacterium]
MSFNPSKVDIKKFLPHRAPMIMIDEYFVIDKKTIGTYFTIKEGTIFVEKGQFSEAGLVENIAQSCSINVGQTYFGPEDKENNSDVIGFISSIKYIHIYKIPAVNDTLTSFATLLSRYDGDDFSICTMKGEITCNEVKILDCELKLFIQRN